NRFGGCRLEESLNRGWRVGQIYGREQVDRQNGTFFQIVLGFVHDEAAQIVSWITEGYHACAVPLGAVVNEIDIALPGQRVSLWPCDPDERERLQNLLAGQDNGAQLRCHGWPRSGRTAGVAQMDQQVPPYRAGFENVYLMS